MENTAVVTLQIPRKHFTTDLEVPLNISADKVIDAIRATYALDRTGEPCLICENPIALLIGKKTFREFGVRNGSTLRCLE
jgi:hypothetical protein